MGKQELPLNKHLQINSASVRDTPDQRYGTKNIVQQKAIIWK